MGQSYLLCIVRRDSMDLDDVLAVLFFISLNNCSKGKVIFVRESKYHLLIDGDNLIIQFF